MKVWFYIVQYPVRWTTQNALHFIPYQTCSFRQKCDFSGRLSGILQLLREHYSPTFPPLSIARYLFIELNELGVVERMKNAQDWKWQQRDSNTDSLNWESSIISVRYRTPQYKVDSNSAYSLLKYTWFKVSAKQYKIENF